MKVLFNLIILLFFNSCASYVNSIHRQIDTEEKSKRMRYSKHTRKGFSNPVTLGGRRSANSQKNRYPEVKRSYNSKGTRRYRANDLVDNESDGSLWSGTNSESFLFVNSSLKRKGDIVIVEVLKELKETIQAELKRTFPERKKKKKKKKSKDSGEAEVTKPTPSSPAALESPDKVYDKISTSVIEEVNQDYVLIRGRKEILYKKYKRYFEFQAIVSQKDITSRDTVVSPKLLESKINILRY